LTVEIFSCLFCNLRGSKPTCCRTLIQNREKQRNSLTVLSPHSFSVFQLDPDEVTVVIEDDGTAVTDDKFFKKLPAQTVFVFLKKGEKWRGGIQ
jgi:hypothetical protein